MKLNHFHIIGSLGLLSLFSACSEKKRENTSSNNAPVTQFITSDGVNREGLMRWLNDNKPKLEREREMDEVQYTLRYQPKEYMALLESGFNAPDSIVRKDLQHYTGMQSFNLRIAIKDYQFEALKYHVKGDQAYDARVKYCAFTMQNDISLLLDGKDTIPCCLFHFERSFDASPVCTFMIGFSQEMIDKKNKNYHDATIMFYDRLFDKGIIKFRFERNDIDNLQLISAI